MRDCFIIALDGFSTALEETFKVLENFQIDWPSCLEVIIDCHFALLTWAVLDIIWYFTKKGYLLYTLTCVTTQLIVSNILRRKKIHKLTFNKAHLLIEMHSRWLPHEAGWENAKSVQSCHQGKSWLLGKSQI
jgi:hypothetical protein